MCYSADPGPSRESSFLAEDTPDVGTRPAVALVIGIVNIVFAFTLKGLAGRVQAAVSGRRL
jgi:hypothetical protein